MYMCTVGDSTHEHPVGWVGISCRKPPPHLCGVTTQTVSHCK